ncbi:hypothetical protein QQ020_22940 [Fulvivirgaceae bacterium BMA12]|uniref:Uncharacterized protein n=1 Tax=Agaribacillus aureus TaxID=3051825 RepID=A0ABT8LDV4_9BACT|nr:hypothetical protein [Fulvivirgaceae bacterium BMA12]
MELLKEKIFQVIEEQLGIKEFEDWLYQQNDLAEMMDQDLILELFSFNYNQNAANYIFKNSLLPYFDQEEFANWKIMANLNDLVIGRGNTERILADFNDMSLEEYPFLTDLGYYRFYFEDCEYTGRSREGLQKDLQMEAESLLGEIQEFQVMDSAFDLKNFVSKQQLIENLKYNNAVNQIISSGNGKKWWEFWK